MTEQTKQKLKDALIEHKNIASSEYNDEDAFVGIYFCDLVDIIDSVMDNTGWHPASEPPKEGEEVMVVQTGSITAYRAVFIDGIYYSVIIGKKAYYPSVEWWCYPPKED